MEIRILHGMDGARAATGVAVVIDVFRAFTTACHAAAAGARPILPTDSPEGIVSLKSMFPGAITAGERFGKPMPGCDFGNSPALIEAARARLAGRAFIHATHAGTRGLLAATGATDVLAASLVNARATARYVRLLRPPVVSLVAMGWTGEQRAEEDDACADYLAALLGDRPFATDGLAKELRNAEAAAKFFEPAQDWAPEEDFHLCLAVDHFPFALRLERDAIPRLVPVVLSPVCHAMLTPDAIP